MSNRNRFRYKLVQLVESKAFDGIIIGLIVLNSFTLAARDYSDTYPEYNVVLEWISEVFAVLFALECVLKIVAHGFVVS